MICPKCGNNLPDNSVACNMCGFQFRPISQNYSQYNNSANQFNQNVYPMNNQSAMYGAGVYNGQTQFNSYPNQPLMPKEMFFKSPGVSKYYRRIKDAGISAYILGGIALLSIVSYKSVFVMIPLIFVLFVIGMGLGIHLACSTVCAILLLVFSSIYVFMCLMLIHFPNGLLLLVDGIYATKTTFDIQNAYKTYVMSNGAKYDFN